MRPIGEERGSLRWSAVAFSWGDGAMSVRSASPAKGRPSLALNRVRFVADGGVPCAVGSPPHAQAFAHPVQEPSPPAQRCIPSRQGCSPPTYDAVPSRRNASLRGDDVPAKRSTEGLRFIDAPNAPTGRPLRVDFYGW